MAKQVVHGEDSRAAILRGINQLAETWLERFLEDAQVLHIGLEPDVEQVAQEGNRADAGVDAALIARYFGSKEDLYLRVLRAQGGATRGGFAPVNPFPLGVRQYAAISSRAATV